MIYFDDPMQDIVQAAQVVSRRNGQAIHADIEYDPSVRRFLFWGAVGYTHFPNDGSTPQIRLSPHIPMKHLLEILAHELAHVIAGPDAGHGDVWERAFSEIHEEYNRINIQKAEDYAQMMGQ